MLDKIRNIIFFPPPASPARAGDKNKVTPLPYPPPQGGGKIAEVASLPKNTPCLTAMRNLGGGDPYPYASRKVAA